MNRLITTIVQVVLGGVALSGVVACAREFHREGMARVRGSRSS